MMSAVHKIATGKTLLALSVSGRNKAQGVSTLNQLEDYGLLQPSIAEKAKKDDGKLLAAKQVRDQLNRSFSSDKSRRENAEDYSAYIENVEIHGNLGGTPAITLYHEGELIEGDNGLEIPYSAVLTAIDGETQLEARYQLRDRLPETGFNEIAITIYHGMPYEAAMKILHDYNAYGKRVSEAVLGNFNTTGVLTLAARKALDVAAIAPSRVNEKGAKGSKTKVIALRQLLTAGAAFQRNGMALTSTVTASHLLRLNKAEAMPLPPNGEAMLAEFARQTAANPAIGQAAILVWQVAGAKVAMGTPPNAIKWMAGIDAYNQTMSGGRGGPRLAAKDRIAAIAAVM